MNKAVIPKYLFENEQIIELQDKGIQVESGNLTLSKRRIPCYCFYNMTIDEVFDELESKELNESTQTDNRNFAARIVAILFLRARQIIAMKPGDAKIAAATSFAAAVTSVAILDPFYAKRLLPLARTVG